MSDEGSVGRIITAYIPNTDIFENVPCMKCEQCGEEFFSTSVLEHIDDILERLEKIASKIFIMDYATAA